MLPVFLYKGTFCYRYYIMQKVLVNQIATGSLETMSGSKRKSPNPQVTRLAQ